MSPFRRSLAPAGVLVVLFLLGADDAARPRPLFDGKSLDGWAKTEFFRPGEVKVEGGALVLATGHPMTGITSTRTDLPRSNYELAYEAKRLDGEDFFAAATFPVGKEFLTFVNGGWGGTITGLSSIDGADASENETGHFVKYENNKWYRFQVRVTDRTVRCWVDDTQVVALKLEGHSLGTRIETRACQPLGFATWESAGALRTITVRGLSAEEIARNDQEKD